MTDKLITNSSDTDKALIEKARDCVCEKCMDKDSCFRENNCPDIQTFIAGATWQREQLEAKILELEKQVEYYIQLKDFHLCDIKHLRAENKAIREQSEIQTTSIRNSLIKELREWIMQNHYVEDVACFDTVNEEDRIDTHKILAKLDLLEKGGE